MNELESNELYQNIKATARRVCVDRSCVGIIAKHHDFILAITTPVNGVHDVEVFDTQKAAAHWLYNKSSVTVH